MQVFNRHVSGRGLTVFGFETLLISGSIPIAAQVHNSLPAAVSALWKIVLVTALCVLCFYYNELYDLTLVHAKRELLVRTLQAAGAAAIVLAIVSILLPSLIIGRGILLTSLMLVLIAVPAWRLIFEGVTRRPPRGTGSASRHRARLRGRRPPDPVAARIRLPGHRGRRRAPEDGERVRLADSGRAADLPRILALYQVERIIVSLTDRRGSLPIAELLEAKLAGVRVEDAAATTSGSPGSC